MVWNKQQNPKWNRIIYFLSIGLERKKNHFRFITFTIIYFAFEELFVKQRYKWDIASSIKLVMIKKRMILWESVRIWWNRHDQRKHKLEEVFKGQFDNMYKMSKKVFAFDLEEAICKDLVIRMYSNYKLEDFKCSVSGKWLNKLWYMISSHNRVPHSP